MDDLTPPSLPAPEGRKPSEADETLSRVDGPGDEASNGPAEHDDDAHEQPVDLVTWAHLVANADADRARRTICRLAVPGLDRHDDSRTKEAALELLEAARAAVARTHRPDLGVVATGGRELLFVLPDGVPWTAVATTVLRAMPRTGGSQELDATTVSVGLAETGEDGESIEEVLRRTALGLSAASADGGGARSITLDAQRRLTRDDAVARSIEEALGSGEGFRLVYQPKFAVEGGSLVGAEALLRHDGGHLGAISPAEFVPIAKRAGMLERLDHWVLDRALDAIAGWRREGILGVPISLNVGPSIFFREGFVEDLVRLTDEHGLDAEDVQVEVGVPDVLDRIDLAAERIHALHRAGVTLALDDFGREEVSIADLRRLPVDVIKVHRSLILELLTSDSAATLARGVLSLAKVLGIETVAAGVEDEEQLALLRDFGCDAVQGYLLSPPLESGAFADRLRANGGRRSVA